MATQINSRGDSWSGNNVTHVTHTQVNVTKLKTSVIKSQIKKHNIVFLDGFI